MKTPYEIYQGLWRPLFARWTSGVNVFDREWDVLVVLDGCRVDTLRTVAAEYPWIDGIDAVRSVGSQSKEWLAKTFTPERSEEIGRTAYVTANPFTENVFRASENDRWFNPANRPTVDESEFGRLVELWQSAWDDDLGTVPPRAVTDAAIDVHRSGDWSRLIVHYMQPHEPFLTPDGPIQDVWDRVRDGRLPEAKARDHYRANVRLVLDEVELLRRSVDAATVALTADHGNAFGEWGIYGHPIGFQHPVVKRVPWVEFTATDDGTYSPSRDEGETTDHSVDERLAALGYK